MNESRFRRLGLGTFFKYRSHGAAAKQKVCVKPLGQELEHLRWLDFFNIMQRQKAQNNNKMKIKTARHNKLIPAKGTINMKKTGVTLGLAGNYCI